AVLQALGFSGYFLIVSEIAEQARSRGIATLGRGSAAGSLVAYMLGITQVDPVRCGLLFERFIHSDRRDMPDIDLDIASDRRDELIGWVFRRFGRDRTAMASSHVTFQRRMAFRDGLKALGLGPTDIDRFCERLPSEDIEPEVAPPINSHPLPERMRESA